MRNVSLTLGSGANRTDALIDINLDLAPGELVAVTGRSGSGKSSLLNVAGGLLRPSSGSITVAVVDLAALSPAELSDARRTSIGYVFQDLNLIASLTAAENISLPLELDGAAPSSARQAAAAALASVGLEGLDKRYPDELSGGQRQRVAIARGLIGDRRLLLADEPTGALDEVTAEGVMQLLRAQCEKGAATLFVTHDPSLAAWADRVIRLRDGRIDTVSTRSARDYSTAPAPTPTEAPATNGTP
jgi:putative ABC transport system ATP-binding protein